MGQTMRSARPDSPGLTAGRGLKQIMQHNCIGSRGRFARPNRRARIETQTVWASKLAYVRFARPNRRARIETMPCQQPLSKTGPIRPA